MSEPSDESKTPVVTAAPRGWMLLFALGPGLMWCGEYIGSGEVILSTRAGAIYGVGLLWVPIIAIFAKFWIGLAGAHYTVTTGEGMIDMLSRTPGPKNWVLWPVFIGQLSSGAVSTGALANVAGIFASYFIPVEPHILGWGAVMLIIALAWTGYYEALKRVMLVLVLFIIAGTIAVALATWPGFGAVFEGVFGFQLPETPSWAGQGADQSPWVEVLPLLGWAAGGFASQVWYTYWVLGAGYGMAKGRGYGRPADTDVLQSLDEDDAKRLRGWRRLVSLDATMAVVIGIVITMCFMIAGAGVLRPNETAPEGADVAIQLSSMFSERWGALGAHLFVLAGLAAMLSTMTGQYAGWPRLLADCGRILIPGVAKWSWKRQFRTVLLIFAAINMLIVAIRIEPVFLVQVSAILDGLLLTPLQALAVGWVLYAVMPQMFSNRVRHLLKPHPILGAGLLLAFVVFSYVLVIRAAEMIAETF